MKVYFKEEKLPMDIMAKSYRYLVCSRKLNRRQDAELLHFEVKRDAYMSFTEAYKHLKNEPVYTVVDLENSIRGGINLIFNPYNYFDKSSCQKLIEDLEEGTVEISRRTRISFEKENITVK